MKVFETSAIRNVVLCSHGSSGKTSWVEAAAYDTNVTDRMGTIAAGNTISDFDQDEAKRQISINLSVVPIQYKDVKINFIDTPGAFDFQGDAISGIRAADASIVFVDVMSGVQVGTEKMWSFCDKRNLPRAIVINKIDRENANFDQALDQITESLTKSGLVMTFPIGEGPNFKGVVDVIKGKAYTFSDNGRKFTEGDIPANLKDKRDEYYEKLVEVVSESDDELLEMFLEGKKPTPEQLNKVLHESVKHGKIYPIFASSGLTNVGVQIIMDAIADLFPAPNQRPQEEATEIKSKSEIKLVCDSSKPFASLVFKTSADPFVGRITYFKVMQGTLNTDVKPYNTKKDSGERISAVAVPFGKKQDPVPELKAGDIGVVTKLAGTLTGDTLCDQSSQVLIKGIEFPKPVLRMAVNPKNKADEDKIGTAIPRLLEEDPSLEYTRSEEAREFILGGQGETHINASAEKLQNKFGVQVTLSIPRIPYRETIRKAVEKAEGKHKKQTGGHGQYGHCIIKAEPLPRGTGFTFTDAVTQGRIPKNFIPAIEKGMRESIVKGTLAGYPVIDIGITVLDGSYHDVDSSELAFKLAANIAFKKAMEDGGVSLLEPIYNLTIIIPDSYMGDIMGDISSRRGRILGSEAKGKYQIIKAQAPLAEVQRYAIDLNSITGGRGTFEMDFDHYEEAPPRVTDEVVEKAKLEADKEG